LNYTYPAFQEDIMERNPILFETLIRPAKTGRKEKKGPFTAATGLHFLPVAGVVDDVAANLDCNQRWGWSSQLEATLLMAKDGVLLLST
jgi:hypothetical protein